MQIASILQKAVSGGASDIHISIGRPPMVRVKGELVPIAGFPPLDADTARHLIAETMDVEQRRDFEDRKEIDFALAVPDVGRFRVNAFVQKAGVCSVLRVIPTKIPEPRDIGLEDAILQFTELHRGLVLVTGPTGSGKSTTLACLLQLINKTRKAHILTIEDPIEFEYTSEQSVVSQRQVGPHTKSFANALRSALRQDPDVILIGEMRDLETIQIAVTVAETGHLVFGTLHTTDAPHTVDRIIDVFPAYQQQQIRMQLSSSLKGVVCQQLLARADGNGRVAAREIMVVTNAIANLIREGKTHQLYSAIESGGRYGMVALDKALADLAARGLISQDDAQKYGSSQSAAAAAAAASAASGPATGGIPRPAGTQMPGMAQRPGTPGAPQRPAAPGAPSPTKPPGKGLFGR